MIKLVVKQPDDGELTTICTREYDQDNFLLPEPKNVVSIPDEDGGEDERFYVENVIHRLTESTPELHLVVRDEQEVLRQVREQRKQQRRQMQQLQQQQSAGGGNPFSNGGNGNDSPFSLS